MNDYISRLKAINSQIANLPGSETEKLGLLQDAKFDTALGGGMAAISGGLSLLNNSVNWAQGADMTKYDNMLQNMSNHRGINYYDNASLLSAYENMPSQYKLDVSELNPTAGQSAMHIGGNVLTGAMTGLTVGGPWGALIGGVVGLGSGILSDGIKRSTNKVNAELFNTQQAEEDRKNHTAFNTGVDQARDTLFADLYKTKKAMGGFLRTPDNRPVGYRIQHSHCKGGTLVRIKA